ncbi:MAG: TetR/AcrR family transcriptional regulator [Chitinophagales bacterium]|nr:TetR/AcrR family transcriptional regulator [Chitinophagales bacterium]
MQKRIVEESQKLFMTYGIRSISMDEIAQRLGISKKTIYQYYKDKDELVNEVIEAQIQQNECISKHHTNCCNNSIHEVFLAMETVEEMLKSMNPILLFDLKKYHPSAYKKLSDFKFHFFYTIVKNNIERGIQEGLYREDVNADIISRFRVASIFMVLDNESLKPNEYAISDIMWEITYLFLYGVATSKGLKTIQKYKQQRLK